MSINGFDRRVAILEARRLPKPPDPRIAEEIGARVMQNLLAVIASLERGEPPNNLVGHAIVAHGGDVEAALGSLVERKRRRVQ